MCCYCVVTEALTEFCLDELGFPQRRHSDEAVSESHAAPDVFPGKRPCGLTCLGHCFMKDMIAESLVQPAVWWPLTARSLVSNIGNDEVC